MFSVTFSARFRSFLVAFSPGEHPKRHVRFSENVDGSADALLSNSSYYKIICQAQVFDESNGYFESDVAHDEYHRGTTYRGRLHYWFLDDEFLKVFDNSDIDCLIWLTPYKYAECIPLGFKLPEVSIFFTKMGFPNRQKYHRERMMPAEE